MEQGPRGRFLIVGHQQFLQRIHQAVVICSFLEHGAICSIFGTRGVATICSIFISFLEHGRVCQSRSSGVCITMRRGLKPNILFSKSI